MSGNDMSVDQILSQMQQLRTAATQRPEAINPAAQGVNEVERSNFADALTQAVGQVNEAQQTTGDLKNRLQAGDDQVTLTEVMLASQRSSVAFEATLQVRNRLVQAYEKVMNMPL
ncbi:flagellar hook-basal body complex protein FliE [Guyparkeria halopsychrophila]|uniref:flagellar hook-basal body complex protein FliE n=1 Tax=Guyparkeria halopsychrophila TaxID=3139421 RepID=UPI0037C89C94